MGLSLKLRIAVRRRDLMLQVPISSELVMESNLGPPGQGSSRPHYLLAVSNLTSVPPRLPYPGLRLPMCLLLRVTLGILGSIS